MTNKQVVSSKKITIGLVLGWIFGTLFALIGIIAIFSEPIPGIVMLIMAITILPPINNLVDEKWKFHLSGGIKASVIIVGFIVLGMTIDTSSAEKKQNDQLQVQQEQKQTISNTEQQTDKTKLAEEQSKIVDNKQVSKSEIGTISDEKQEEISEKKQDETLSQKSAIRKARTYLDVSGFSKSSLVKQLKFEGFPNEDAVYAVGNIDVDWNEQAERKARTYLDLSGFSRSGLIKQLKFEGFTNKQATYGVDAIGL